MRILLVSTNTLPAAPTGPVYVAGALRQAGHIVEIFECLFAEDLRHEIKATLDRFQPDVIGVSIRLVHGDVQDAAAPYGTRYIDLRKRVKEIVDIIRSNSPAHIVLGGPGFNYYARDWLEFLDLQYGIRGEGEEVFPQYLQHLAERQSVASIPGCVARSHAEDQTVPPRLVQDLNCQALPAYDLLDWDQYAGQKITPAVFTKRGCAFACTFCPYSKLEGKRYRLKSAQRVMDEIQHIMHCTGSRRIMFCDNSFNVPLNHAEDLCRAFIKAGCGFEWGSGDIKPVGLSPAFCQLMKDSGCFYASLALESASEGMLQRMQRGYTARHVRQSLEALSGSGLLFGASLLLGAPGETPETIAETLGVMQDYSIPLGVWVTIGVYLWTDYQDIVAEARSSGCLKASQSLFDGPVYLSPALSQGYLAELVHELRSIPGYTVQVNRSDLLQSRE